MDLYELLEVSKTATTSEIKRAFRKKSVTAHPDKGGDEETFKKINLAYEVLGNPEKRERYDKHGLEGLNDSFDESGLHNIFRDIFSGFSPFSFFGNNDAPPFNLKIHEVSLEELCERKNISVTVAIKDLCECNTPNNFITCVECKGKGCINMRAGPFLAQTSCNKCSGNGKIIKECKINSKEHNGIKLIKKKVNITLSPEMCTGYRHVLRNEGDYISNNKRTDVVIDIRVKNHDFFECKGGHLSATSTITLQEALCGFTKTIKHPSQEDIVIHTDKVTSNGDTKVISGKGMTSSTDMCITFNVKFPIFLSQDQKNKISEILS